MKERPILFSASMVRAILEGRKTQTRRVVKPQPKGTVFFDGQWLDHGYGEAGDTGMYCPYGQPGDRLWVRETCCAEELTAETDKDRALDGLDGVRYAADGHFEPIKNTLEAADAWVTLNAYRGKHGATVPAIHMPRWASRITLEITDVRVQRVQDISEDDACSEGCATARFVTDVPSRAAQLMGPDCYRAGFACLWDSINAKRGFGWDANPWVWALTFMRVEQPI